MEKLDFKRELGHLYGQRAGKVSVVDVPEMRFLMVDGSGDPNTAAGYREAVEALFSVSYTVKFAVRKTDGVDYGVMPLEGLWWTDGGERESGDILASRDQWRWRMMVMQPEPVSDGHVERAISSVRERKGLPGLGRLRFEVFYEGRAAQTLHIGPYAEEWPAIERVHAFIEERGSRLTGIHHEVYLKDPRRSAPENLRTVIRQPFTD